MGNDILIKVGMADLRAASDPSILTTLGLGSCVGVALYDVYTKTIGLAHVMLPSSLQARNNSNVAKFADTAIVKLLEDMKKLGAKPNGIVAKLAGGAQMFSFAETSEMLRIGTRNVIAAKECLKELNIPVVAEDTGGNFGRTIELYSDTGILLIKTIGHGTKQI
ncbi:chemotaxis protein CheD [Clostridium thermosuccinogenes]|jgi:chemotaxis protein CheD|uniref:Probable chemoreceptor glutamine deamidase CheD n=1 Tax=Clostridium thermosuccinogenes TaxID=84032 RepID=A0A2K2FPF5_9CLOT|nr:chemotaxis protein CheD [Pseudoclostridium thermosuccinogenes]AUS96351.1 chemotaxis protein CheD [Pseudoclostridium thermosuccinogenes]PNT92975.1 chemotaxis protein CheD [Pseudoclostridium thermosuccinogenes]PNT98565.1 chemotaxis protein CheD [Pseudoclostridium thermosuccinogenes]PNU00667.1 chemotaxis protein CheD [Pseudoclostridium thermosuccinogenes]